MQSGPSLEMNPLVDCAGTILSLVTQLKNTASHPDIRLLYQKTVELVREYERQLRDYQIDPETVFNARYALCALIDETVLNTPWGSHSFWSTESLLTSFHRETWGGEHVYQILEIALRAPDQSRNILELIYICMSLGFMGKLRVVERGTIQHDEIRDRIFRTLRPHMGDYQKELSPQWQSNEKRFNRLRGLVPTWVIMSVLTMIIVGVYMGFSWHLNELSNPIHTEIHALVPWGVSKEAKKLPPPVEEVDQANTIRRLLQPEIQKGLVEIEGIPGQITIMLNNKGLFASGTAKVATAIAPVLQKIADALEQTEGEIFVIGHTDNIPIFTPKFPSNWHLSVDRAKAVSTKIAINDALKSRITAEGRGDTEPLYPNDTSKNRALNRRVEIILLQ